MKIPFADAESLHVTSASAIARRQFSLMLVAAALGGASFPALAETVTVGSQLPALGVVDQHERPLRVETHTRFLVFAADKAGSDIVNKAMTPHPGAFGERRIVYVADISAMPAMVTRMFALPKLRKLPFAVGLVQKPEITAHLPRKPGEVTLITLEQGRVQAIEYLPTEAALLHSLGIAAS